MRHLDDGVLRRMIDEPFTVTASQRNHFNSCSACQVRYGDILAEARSVSGHMTVASTPIDTTAALARVRARVSAEGVTVHGSRRRFGLRGPGRWRLSTPLSAGVLAAALVGAGIFSPAGSWAQSFITIFQPTQVAVVPVTSADLRSLPDLRQYGTVQAPKRVSDIRATTLRAAAAASHLNLLAPGTLAADIAAHPQYNVIPGQSGTFTFSAAKAAQTAAAQGKSLPAMPPGIDGSTLRLTTGNAVIALYGAGLQGGIPTLVIGQMRSPTVESTGASVQEIENYVLNLPGVSPSLARAVRAIGDPTTTLPIPIPVDIAHAQSVTIQGVRGLVVGDQTGVGSVVIWQKNGMIYGVGGTLAQDRVLAIAAGLHRAGGR